MKKTKTEMRQEIKKLFEFATDEKTIRLAIERMQEYDIPTDDLYNNEKYITRTVLARCNDKMKHLLENPPEAPIQEKINVSFDDIWDEAGTDKKREWALDYVDNIAHRGRLSTDTNGGFRTFLLKEINSKEVSLLTASEDEIKDTITCTLAEMTVAAGNTASPTTQDEMYWYWKRFTDKLGREFNECPTRGVVSCSSPLTDADRYTLYYSSYQPDSTVPFPNLMKTINRMKEGKAFCALIWGVYSGKYRGRQVIWIYGGHGEEGKSYLVKFLGKELFGENFGMKSIDGVHIKNNSNFMMSDFVGAKLVIYPDCNRVHLMEMEAIKQLSSGGRDSTVSEAKFKNAQTVTLEARIIVCSNFLPKVLADNWYQSRLILCPIERLTEAKDPTIDEKYKIELPGFLAYCAQCYEELCKDNEAIQVSSGHAEMMKSLIETSDPLEKEIFEKYFVMDTEGKVPFKKVNDILEVAAGKKSERDRKEYLDWIQRIPFITLGKYGNRRTFFGFRELPGNPIINTSADTSFDDYDKEVDAALPTFEELQKRKNDLL